jgi:hypothetical protein
MDGSLSHAILEMLFKRFETIASRDERYAEPFLGQFMKYFYISDHQKNDSHIILSFSSFLLIEYQEKPKT